MAFSVQYPMTVFQDIVSLIEVIAHNANENSLKNKEGQGEKNLDPSRKEERYAVLGGTEI